MIEKEMAVLESIGRNAEKLDPVKRQRLLGYSEGLAASREVVKEDEEEHAEAS